MIRSICLVALLTAAACFFHVPVSASGSIGPGSGKISPRAAYAQGKALTFDVLVCDSCPVRKNELDRARAQSLADSLEAVHDGKSTGSPDDEAVKAVCGVGTDGCKVRMEVVHYFLSRRFKL